MASDRLSSVLGTSAGNAESTATTDPWRKLSAMELRANTVVFPAANQTKLVDHVLCLKHHGIQASAILSIQVSTAGQCRLTFSTNKLVETITIIGFSLNGRHIFPQSLAGSKQTLQLHIHDVPIWVSDHAIEAALSLYGSVQGPEWHGKVEVRVQEGLYIASGVRFATFKQTTPKKAIPSYI